MADLSCCGTDCSTCGCYGSMCNGCNSCKGQVFHAPKGQACAIYACAVNEKKMKNCGACKELPCDIWMRTRDPQFTDEAFAENVAGRVKNLRTDTRNL